MRMDRALNIIEDVSDDFLNDDTQAGKAWFYVLHSLAKGMAMQVRLRNELDAVLAERGAGKRMKNTTVGELLCSDELWRVRQDPVCQPIVDYAESLPLSELMRALEILRLCAMLYVELQKGAGKGQES